MPETISRTGKELRTDDLAMAAFLNLSGFKHVRLNMKDRRSAEWVFFGDGPLHEAAETYQHADARVEPLEFNRTLRDVRDELYQFLRSSARR
jgi:hypothetical protein